MAVELKQTLTIQFLKNLRTPRAEITRHITCKKCSRMWNDRRMSVRIQGRTEFKLVPGQKMIRRNEPAYL